MVQGLLSLHILQQPLFGPAHLQHRQPWVAYFQVNVLSLKELSDEFIAQLSVLPFLRLTWQTGAGYELWERLGTWLQQVSAADVLSCKCIW
jgi:hypothetical protein